MVSAGDLTRTARIIAELDQAGWPGAAQPDAGFMVAYRAALETGRRHPDRALEILRPFEPFELGSSWGFIPLYERALAHLAAGDWQAARTAFEKLLAHPGVRSYSYRLLWPVRTYTMEPLFIYRASLSSGATKGSDSGDPVLMARPRFSGIVRRPPTRRSASSWEPPCRLPR